MKIFKVTGMGSLVFLPFFLSVTAEAQIYKCSNEQGEVYYNDKPCPIEDEEKRIGSEKDVLNGYVPNYSPEKESDQKQSTLKTEQKKSLANTVPKKAKEKPKKGGKSPRSGSRRGENSARKSNRKGVEKAIAPTTTKSRTNQKLTLKDKKRMLGIYHTVE